MSTPVEILDRHDVLNIINKTALNTPYEFSISFEFLFQEFLKHRYKVTLEQFDKLLKENIPEELI